MSFMCRKDKRKQELNSAQMKKSKNPVDPSWESHGSMAWKKIRGHEERDPKTPCSEYAGRQECHQYHRRPPPFPP